MQTTVEPTEANKAKLVVTLDDTDLDKALTQAFSKIAKEVRIPGFRPGKAPRRILEQRIGLDYARQVAIEDSLPDFYSAAVRENDLDVINVPQLNLLSGAEVGTPVSFDAEVELRPEIRVPGYDGLRVTIASPKATEIEIDDQLGRMLNQFSEIKEVDRQAQPGDHARIDVAGTIDGEAVPGLTASDYLYEVGQGSVVPELDQQLMGASAGDVLDFQAAVPGDEESSPIEFHVVLKAVSEKVLPTPDDAFASANSEFSTIADLRGDIAKRVGMVKRVQSYLSLRDETLKALVELVDIDEVPGVLLDQEVQNRIQDLANRLSQQGATIEQYLEATGQPADALIAEMREGGADNVKADLALRAVSKAEAIEVTDAEVEAEIVRLAERFKMKVNQVRRNIESNGQMHTLRADVRKTKTLNWLMERVSLVDEDGREIDRADLELSPAELAQADEAIDAAELDVDDHDGDDDDDHTGHDHD
jgi:trigger factor